MILLHHKESELSRNLLADIPASVASIDCTDGVPEDYTGPQPSAFPSVVVDVPAYMLDVPDTDADGGFLGMKRVEVPAHQEALRMPNNWATVAGYLGFVTARAEANAI
jgi:hypothetical protein